MQNLIHVPSTQRRSCRLVYSLVDDMPLLTPGPNLVSVEMWCNWCCCGREENVNKTETATKARLAYHDNYICVCWLNFMRGGSCRGVFNPLFSHMHVHDSRFSCKYVVVVFVQVSECLLLTVFMQCSYEARVIMSCCVVRCLI